MGGKGSGGKGRGGGKPKTLDRQIQFFVDPELSEWLKNRNRSFNLSYVLRELLRIFKECNEDFHAVREKVKKYERETP